jgi:hypothetical protein
MLILKESTVSVSDVLTAVMNSKRASIAIQTKFLTGEFTVASVGGGGFYFNTGTGRIAMSRYSIAQTTQTVNTNNLSKFELHLKDGTVVTITVVP